MMPPRFRLGIVGLLAIVLLGLRPAMRAQQATQVDARVFASLTWRELGPMRAGRTTAAAASPDTGVFYAGVSGAGLWTTNDFGTSWRLVHDAPPRGVVTAVATAPSRPSTIYAALERGIARSNDAGRTWSAPVAEQIGGIARIAVDPREPSRLWVAAQGDASGSAASRGLFRSVDASTFARVAAGDPGAAAVDVAVAPDNPSTIYAALTDGVSASPAGGHAGIFRSVDGGTTWERLARGLPVSLTLRSGSLAIARARPQRIYATIAAGSGSGLYRSDDRGDSWEPISRDARVFDGDRPGSIAVDARNADALFITGETVWMSSDGGATFRPWPAQPPATRIDALAQSPSMPAAFLAGGGDGTIVTVNDGATWSSPLSQPTADLSNLTTDSGFPYRVCGALPNTQAVCVPSAASGRMPVGDLIPLQGPGGVLADPLDPDLVYGGSFERYDRRTGQVQDVGPVDAPGNALKSFVYGADGRTLYAAGTSVWRTNNGGQTWTNVGPPAMREAAQGTTAATASAFAIWAIDPRVLWIATADGRLHTTRDGAATWRTMPGPVADQSARAIEVSHFDGNSAYVVLGPTRAATNPVPVIWRTRDAGVTWTPIATGLASVSSVTTVKEDPQRRGLLFAATDRSVFVSFDDGETWQPLRLNLPMTPVQDLLVRDSSVIVATAGRGFWRLDDMAALRQLTGDIARAPAYLFRPAPAWRPGAGSAPQEAIFTYLVGSALQGRITLDVIETGTGEIIRRFEGTAGAGGSPTTQTAAPLDASPGLHQVRWDLRFTPSVAGSRGPAVLPGTYQVRLTAGDRAIRQAVVIKMDPRVRATPADLGAQLKAARALDARAMELEQRLPNEPGPADAETREALAELLAVSRRIQDVDARPSPRLEAAAAVALSRADAVLRRR